MLKLTIFNSPFPVEAPVKILSSVVDDVSYDENDIIQLYNRSLLTRIESDDLNGRMNSGYWLYTFHPATRNYVDDKINEDASYNYLQTFQDDYKVNFGYFYLDLLSDTYYSIGNENHRDSFARFNILTRSEDNDFNRSIVFLQDIEDDKSSAYIQSYLALISREMGLYLKAIDYYKQSLESYCRLDDREALAANYTNWSCVF